MKENKPIKPKQPELNQLLKDKTKPKPRKSASYCPVCGSELDNRRQCRYCGYSPS